MTHYGKKIIGYCYKNMTRCCKNCFKKVVHKTAEATGQFIGNKITDKIEKPKSISDMNSRNVEEMCNFIREKTRNIE